MFFKKFTVVENTPPYWKKENKLLIFILVVVRTTDKGVLYFPYFFLGGGGGTVNEWSYKRHTKLWEQKKKSKINLSVGQTLLTVFGIILKLVHNTLHNNHISYVSVYTLTITPNLVCNTYKNRPMQLKQT